MGFPDGLVVKNPPANAGDSGDEGIQPLGQEGPLEESMATHSGVLAGRTPWTEEPAGYSPKGCKELEMTEVTGAHEKSCTSRLLLSFSLHVI